MSDDYQKQLLAYNEDKRTACKYGDKCYQKNPKHLEKFKHPPSDNLKVNFPLFNWFFFILEKI